MFNNRNLQILIVVVALAILAYFSYNMFINTSPKKSEQVPDVKGHNHNEHDGLVNVSEERDHGVDKEYRTNEFAPNFINDLERAGVYDLQ